MLELSPQEIAVMDDYLLQGLGEGPKSFKLYDGEVELYFDDSIHQYTTYGPEGMVVVPGVTTITHIIDKSAALMQWAANMAVDAIRANFYTQATFPPPDELEQILQAAKYAHRDYKENAADIGHIAHDHIEQYIKAYIRNSNDDMKFYRTTLPDNVQAANGAIAAFDWMDRHSVKWIFTEKKIYSREHNYAGTADGLAFVSSCGDRKCCYRLVKHGDDYQILVDEFLDVLAPPDWKTSNSLYPEYWYQTAAYAKAFTEEYPNKYVPKHRFINRLGKDDAKFESIHRGPETLERDFNAFLSALRLHNAIELVKDTERKEKALFKDAFKREKERLKVAEKEAKAIEKDRQKRVKAFIKAGLSEEEAERQSLAA